MSVKVHLIVKIDLSLIFTQKSKGRKAVRGSIFTLY
jgi:hypothetical protein